jgi:hypothetical protein
MWFRRCGTYTAAFMPAGAERTDCLLTRDRRPCASTPTTPWRHPGPQGVSRADVYPRGLHTTVVGADDFHCAARVGRLKSTTVNKQPPSGTVHGVFPSAGERSAQPNGCPGAPMTIPPASWPVRTRTSDLSTGRGRLAPHRREDPIFRTPFPRQRPARRGGRKLPGEAVGVPVRPSGPV